MIVQDFSGLWIPVVTPFVHGEIDHGALKALVLRLKRDGVGGFVASSSTGEGGLLNEAEQNAALATTVEAAGGLPVIMGVSGLRPERVAARTQWLAERFPLHAFLLPPPSYIRPSQAGLLSYFRTVADATPLPLVLYDIPYRTGVKIELATLLELAAHPAIQGLKDCGGQPASTEALIGDGRLAVLAGEDHQIFGTLALGGTGAITASAHLQTPRFVALVQSLLAGDLPRGRMLWRQLRPLIELCFDEPNPAPIKAMLARQGAVQNELRAPLQPASAELQQRFGHLLQDIE
ncbi:4-hydroxy-tetrahydrodipicolinate synthase family protein [Roseateles toxinivorans]|uniref:4-hydroxy-tetrahydrodipicolinate synthase n=1 Tax=Roseateles toxinivorans TaxID=270368 RepID=A0A4R6QUM5_9BURK|nr:4-hydroxy-tetrahydrodipicolinate synthase [Roseateles toxinivorans]TDP74335.1 4-hydroxy-tetrahydrodipicolinate synthase [Roseateles toxinivorans]